MLIAKFVAFLIVTRFFALQIFGLTTYHAYFFRALPLLVAYSVLVGYAMYAFEDLHRFWFTFLWANALWFVIDFVRQQRAMRSLLAAPPAGFDPKLARLSIASTTAYFILSVLAYLGTATIAFIAFLNS